MKTDETSNADTNLDLAEEEEVKPVRPKSTRVLTNEDILNYDPMVEGFIREYVIKNWNEASSAKSRGDVPLGNSGYSVNDIRQHLRAEVCIALYNFNPNHITKEGRTVKESTFVFNHLFNRIGQLMKRLTKRKMGYGVWHSNIEETLFETERE